MFLISSSAEWVTNSNPYKHIEKIGRTCYKSEDKITDDSCYKFVDGLINRQHFAMLEHATFHFLINTELEDMVELINIPGTTVSSIEDLYLVTLNMSHMYNPKWDDCNILKGIRKLFKSIFELHGKQDIYVYGTETTNSVIQYGRSVECLLNYFQLEEAELNKFKIKHSRLTAHIICDRGVSHELVRHRLCSFAQESTRYCNYGKDKFGGVTFIEPSGYEDWDENSKNEFIESCKESQDRYLNLIELGKTPQQARAVLTNAIKTEMYVTATIEEWCHIFDLRYNGTTGQPHPDMKLTIEPLVKTFDLHI